MERLIFQDQTLNRGGAGPGKVGLPTPGYKRAYKAHDRDPGRFDLRD